MRCSECGGKMKIVETTVERVEIKGREKYVNRLIRQCEECGSEIERCSDGANRRLAQGVPPVDRVSYDRIHLPRIKDGVYED